MPRTGRRGCGSWPQAGCWAVSSLPAEPDCGKSPSVRACTTWRTWVAARRDDAAPKAGFQARLHFTWVSHPHPETLARLGQFCRRLSMSGQCGVSLSIRCDKQAHAPPMPEGGARCVSHLTRGNQPAGSAGRASLAEQPDRRGWRKLDGSQRGRVHPGLTEQHAVGAQRSSKKRQTKPIEISHKSLALRELTSDGFGLLYAKQTQFRVVEAATSEGWRCRKPARRQAWPTLDRVAQIGAQWDRQTRKRDNACPAGAAGRVGGGEWRMADGGGQTADGGCRADDEYRVSLGGCVAGNSSEPMAQAYPDVPAEVDQEPQKVPNKANLESTQSSSPQKVESGLTGPAGPKRSSRQESSGKEEE